MSRPHLQKCSIASFLNLFGDSWTLMVIREAVYGATRFGEFQKRTGIAKNILSDRLRVLVDEGVLEKVDVGEQGVRYAYHLTEKGESLTTILLAMIQWGDEWVFGDQDAPIVFQNRRTGERLAPLTPAWEGGKQAEWSELEVVPGPGADRAARARFGKSAPPRRAKRTRRSA